MVLSYQKPPTICAKIQCNRSLIFRLDSLSEEERSAKLFWREQLGSRYITVLQNPNCRESLSLSLYQFNSRKQDSLCLPFMATCHRRLLLLLLFLFLLLATAGSHTTIAPIVSSPTLTYGPAPTPTTGGAHANITTPSPPEQGNQIPHRPEQLNNIIDALVGAGDFNSWANVLSVVDPYAFPLSATLFVPADDPFSPSPAAITVDPFIIPYHIVPQRLSFAQLRQLKPFSRLPTLLPAMSILITNTSLSNFTLDGSLLSHPDLYTTSSFSVHGVATLLDYSVYGALKTSAPPPPPSLTFVPRGEHQLIGRHGQGGLSSASVGFSTKICAIFLVAIAFM